MGANVMTRAERKGILILLILLALIVGGMALKRCGHEIPSAVPSDSLFIPVADTIINMPDTLPAIDKSSRKSRKRKSPKPVKQVPERSPLDEIIS